MTAISHRILSISFIVLILGSFFADAKKKITLPDNSDFLKSDYVFMEAMRQSALDNVDDYFMLLRRAHHLDSNNTDIGFLYGYLQLIMSQNDSTVLAESLNLMKRHFDAKPDDFYNSFIYGNVNNRIGNGDESLRVWAMLDSLFPEKPIMAVKYAETLTSTGDSANMRKSIELYNRVEIAEGRNANLTARKISILNHFGDTSAITTEIEELLSSSPLSAEYNILAGDVYHLALGKNQQAIKFYDKAVELDPASGHAYFARANFYHSIGDSIAYDREIFRALSQDNLELDTKLELLTGYIRELYTDTVQQPRIKELLNTLVDLHPHEVDIHDLYFSYCLAVEDMPGAKEQMGYALDIDPSNPRRWGSLISLYAQDNDFAQATEIGEVALHYHPDDLGLYELLSACFQQNKQYDKAMDMLNRSMAHRDSSDTEAMSNAWGLRGDIYAAAGQIDSCFAAYDKALTLNRHNSVVLNNYAYFLAEEGRDLDRAESMSATTINYYPNNDTYLDTYAWILFKQKRYVEAKEYINRTLQNSDKPSHELYQHAGDIYFMTGDPDKALEFWQQALELAPDNELLQRKVKHKTFFYE